MHEIAVTHILNTKSLYNFHRNENSFMENTCGNGNMKMFVLETN